jgi:hypothetical protein
VIDPNKPYTGPCPPWGCVNNGDHGPFPAGCDHHWRPIGKTPTALMPYPDEDEDRKGWITYIEVEVVQHVIEDEHANVHLNLDALDEIAHFTADEAEQIARNMLEAVAVIRETEAQQARTSKTLVKA